ncbi:MAG TPA: c-type cytochrome biogenesis protein CcmI [Hyphomicrobiales bacterium]|nr:c-type cytochrome biogenesis protein CcmI [Hyphomicrobiales bacterium]
MTTFWLTLTALTLIAMAFVAVPLWRGRDNVAGADTLALRRDKNREVFLQRQQELDHELEQGVVTSEDHARMRVELERAFLRDMEALEGKAMRSGARRALILPLVGLLLIPLASLLLYRHWGAAPDLMLPQLVSAAQNANDEASQRVAFEQLADHLQARFDRRPDDLQSAYMLGTLYLEIERYQDAAAVFRRMLESMPQTPDRATVLGQLAQAEYVSNDAKIDEGLQAIIDEALSLNPNENSVLSILAIDAFYRQDLTTAIGYWRRQLALSPPGSAQAIALQQRIAAVEPYLPEDQQQDEDAAPTASVTLTIDIAPEFKDSLDEYAGLFVYVRNPAAMGMPIVAQNLEIPDFPLTLTLDDSNTMMGMTLGSAPELLAGARLSRSGQATRQAGDLQTESTPFKLDELEGPLMLTIDQVVEGP